MSGYKADLKDRQRIANIYGRSVGQSHAKCLDLARQMANAIKDAKKACRRGDAAWHFNWEGMPANLHEQVAEIFYDRARYLGGEEAFTQWTNKLAGLDNIPSGIPPGNYTIIRNDQLASKPPDAEEPVQRGKRKIKL